MLGLNRFRRAALYGADPPRWRSNDGAKTPVDDPQRTFGNSVLFVSSMALAANQERSVTPPPASLDHERVAAELVDVAACAYEDGTDWGDAVGWVYNIATEDVVTGFRLHRKGW
jgi:mixed-linked glucan synthase